MNNILSETIIISIKSLRFSSLNICCNSYYVSGFSYYLGYFNFIYETNKPISLNILLRNIVEKYKNYFCITKNPKNIILCSLRSSHLLVHLKNFINIQSNFQLIDNSYVTASNSLKIKLNDKNNNSFFVHLNLFDPLLLMPSKSTLADLADTVGIELVSIPTNLIHNLDSIYLNDPDLLTKYCWNETNIVLNYWLRYYKIYHDYLIDSKIPSTIGSFSVQLFMKYAEQNNIDVDFLFGYETRSDGYYNERKSEYVSRDIRIFIAPFSDFENLSRESYHGGRNECYFHGITPTDTWSDWDIISAYTTILAMLSPLDYDNSYDCTNPSEYQPEIPAFARVYFKFPDDTRYPVIPVRTENGLLFPLEGESYVTSPEIYLAIQLGASIEIKNGRIFPFADGSSYPFLEFIQNVQQKRNSFPKQSLENIFWKQIGNSLYGKISQGIGMKRVFDSRRGSTKQIYNSKITNPFFASYITGYIRAIIAEIMNKIPQNKQIISVTTDGFITNATDDEVFQACNGRISNKFSIFRSCLSGNNTVLDKKHVANKLVSWKTRGIATITNDEEDDKIILAKSNIQTPYTKKIDQNKWTVNMFFNRDKKTCYSQTTTTPISDIIKNGGGIPISTTKSINVNMDYDFKRLPAKVYEDTHENNPVLCFSTIPFQNIENYNVHARIFGNYKKSNNNCLKTMNDFENWVNYYKSVDIQDIKQNKRRTKRNGKSDIHSAVKEFTTAYSKKLLNLRKTMKYTELASWFNNNGFSCTVVQLKNYAKTSKKFYNNSVPKTKETLRFVELIKTKFSDFDEHEFFVNRG